MNYDRQFDYLLRLGHHPMVMDLTDDVACDTFGDPGLEDAYLVVFQNALLQNVEASLVDLVVCMVTESDLKLNKRK